MEMALIKEKVWVVVGGNTPKPTPKGDEEKMSEAEANAIEEWKAKDDNMHAMILLAVSDLQLPYIRNCKTSTKAWKKLADVHKGKALV